MPFHLKQILIAIDQLGNTLLGGWADETISSRCYRVSKKGIKLPMIFVDTLLFFDKNHCKTSFINERKRLQSPPEER